MNSGRSSRNAVLPRIVLPEKVGRSRRVSMAVAVVCLSVGMVAPPALSRPSVAPASDNSSAPYVPGVVLVGYGDAVAPSTGTSLRLDSSAIALRAATLMPGVDRLELAPGMTVDGAIRQLSGQPGIRYVEPDYLIEPAYLPDDPLYTAGDQWGVGGDGTSPASDYGAAAAEAWAAGYVGSADVYVGIVDEGFQHNHDDLRANAWTNPFDPPDGRDNDGNGYVDDLHGWDFFNNDNSVFDGTGADGRDDHGTHVAGIIGASGGNGLGVAGVNWSVTMISAKFLGPSGGSTSGAIRALSYLTDLRLRHGLNVVATNNSWGYRRGYGTALLEAIERSGDAGMLFVAAAGNDDSNNDQVPFNPASFRCTTRQDTGNARGYDCIVSVASIAANGNLSSFSNRGATSVDLGAPGQNVMSTFPRDQYGRLSGTSMAAPHVTGAVALCASMNPALDARALRAAILSSTRATPSLKGRSVTGGRLDIGAMLRACAPDDEPIVGSPRGLSTSMAGPRTVRLDWVDGAENERAYEIQHAQELPGGCASWDAVDFVGPDSTRYESPGRPGQGDCFRVRAIGAYPGSTVSPWSNQVVAHLPAITPGPPRDVRVAAFSEEVTVTWLAPADDGGSDVTGYRARASPGGQACVTSGELTCTVGDLTNGTTYRFTVVAINAIGTGPPSGASNPVVPATVPTAPIAVHAQARDAAAVVTWDPPASDGGRSIAGYEVASSPAGGSCTTEDRGCIVRGLSNGTSYTFTVRARNAIGAGPGSAPSTPVTPTASAGAVPAVDPPTVALVSSRKVRDTVTLQVSWRDATQSTDAYELQRRSGDGPWKSVTLSAPSDTTARVTVKRTARHSFRVRAVDPSGLAGDWATTSSVAISLLQETAPAITYSAPFKRSSVSGALGGYVRQAANAARTATLLFSGSSVALVTTLSQGRGIAEIWLDGVRVATVDLYATSRQTRQIAWAGSFAAGSHSLAVRVRGDKNPASNGTRVDIDAFLVLR